jgi:hypothetical protein
MRSINTLYFRQNNSLILKLTSGQRKIIKNVTLSDKVAAAGFFSPNNIIY